MPTATDTEDIAVVNGVLEARSTTSPRSFQARRPALDRLNHRHRL
jgi:hypothetical protein